MKCEKKSVEDVVTLNSRRAQIKFLALKGILRETKKYRDNIKRHLERKRSIKRILREREREGERVGEKTEREREKERERESK